MNEISFGTVVIDLAWKTYMSRHKDSNIDFAESGLSERSSHLSFSHSLMHLVFHSSDIGIAAKFESTSLLFHIPSITFCCLSP